jgi:hypothetical protein
MMKQRRLKANSSRGLADREQAEDDRPGQAIKAMEDLSCRRGSAPRQNSCCCAKEERQLRKDSLLKLRGGTCTRHT